MSSGVLTVGRPKRGAPEPPPEERGERETVVHMKGSPAYVDWLERMHKKTRIPKVQLFRIAMEDWAAKNGHEAPPEI